MNERYNKHYIRIDAKGGIIDGWSDGPHPEKRTEGAVCISDHGGYQFRLSIDGRENPALLTVDDIPLYRWDGEAATARTAEEIEVDRRALVLPEPAPSLESRVDALETETASISAAIERGLSL